MITDNAILMELDDKKIRIRRYNSMNFVIEVYTEGITPKTREVVWSWKIYGYYGRIEHVIPGLTNLCIKTPIGDNLEDQLYDLNNQLKRVEASLVEAISKVEDRL